MLSVPSTVPSLLIRMPDGIGSGIKFATAKLTNIDPANAENNKSVKMKVSANAVLSITSPFNNTLMRARQKQQVSQTLLSLSQFVEEKQA